MKKIDQIQFQNQVLDIYGSASRPCFIASDIAKIIDYSSTNTSEMLNCLEKDETFKTILSKGGQRRTVLMVTELGLYNILSQSRKPIARMWRRVVHQQLIETRKMHGLSVKEQFDEWDAILDDTYIDSKTGRMMKSITIPGGDVEQVPCVN